MGGGRLTSNVTWTPTFRKLQLARKGLSQRAQNHNQHRVTRTEPIFLAVQATIRTKMRCDKKTLLAEADASKKRNLMLVGGHADNAVDLCGEGNADAKRPCLGKRQTMLTKYPHIQCFTCPAHGIDGFTKIICGSKEEIQMQRIFAVSPHPLSVSPVYTQTHRDTGMFG